MSDYRYSIDGQDSIRRLSDSWQVFARQNDAAHLTADSVLGQPIWEYVHGLETRYLYDLLFTKVRSERQPIDVPFRCDAPNCRRYMQLTISPSDEDSLDFISTVLREESRPRLTLLDAGMPHTDEFLSMCAWCKRIEVNDDKWTEAEEAIVHLDLFGQSILPGITHGICADCYESIEALQRA